MQNLFTFLSILLAICLFSTNSNAQAINYKVQGQEYEGYMVNKGPKAPTVLLIHDWDGLTDYEVERAKMLGKLGFSVIAADLFGKGVRPTEVKDKKQHTGELYKDRAKMRSLMLGALEAAKKNKMNVTNAIAIGYCFGGAAVLELARSGTKMKGFASFHGGLKTPPGQSYAKTSGKVLIYHGTADKMISMEDFANLAIELENAKVPNEMLSFGGADHAFTVFKGKRYDKQADQSSWDHFVKFLKS